jgi:cytochrome oxidase assembly protein ShyY1
MWTGIGDNLAKEQTKLEPKVILLIVAVVALVALAIWQVSRNTGGAADVSFNTKIQAPPDSTRPPGFEKPGDEPVRDKQ